MHAFRCYIFAARIACDSGPTCLIYDPNSLDVIVNPTDPLIIRFRESYNSMSMSRESPSLKKSSSDCLKLAKHQWRRQNFSAAGAQPGHQNLDWGTFEKLCVTSLFEVEASSYTVGTNGSTHGSKIVFYEKMVVHNNKL